VYVCVRVCVSVHLVAFYSSFIFFANLFLFVCVLVLLQF